MAFVKDGQIYGYAITRGPAPTPIDKGEKPLVWAAGTNSNPRWSPDGSKLAFVSDRADHSFIGIFDVKKRTVTFISPSVDRDSSPTWSHDGKRIAFIRRPGLPFGMQAQQGGGGIGNPMGPVYNPAQAGARGRAEGAVRLACGCGGPSGWQRGGAANAPLVGVPGLYSATLPGGYRLSFRVADVATGESREFWHPTPDATMFGAVNSIMWAGDSVLFTVEPGEWLRFYAVKVDGPIAEPLAITPDEGFIEGVPFTSLSADGRTLFYCNNLGDIERRHVWKVSTSGGDPGAAHQRRRDRDLPGAGRLRQAGGHAQRRRAPAAVDYARARGRRRPEDHLPDAAEGVPARAARHPRERDDEGGRRPRDPQPAVPAEGHQARASAGRR